MARGNSKQRKIVEPEQVVLQIESLDMNAQGIAHREPVVVPGPVVDASDSQEPAKPIRGKVVFVEGALTGETVVASITKSKNSYETAQTTQVLRSSTLRVQPRCQHFGVCGGCSMQHIEPSAQVAIKQRVLEDNLWHLARLRPTTILRPIHGPTWGYRYRARLSVRYVEKKGGVLVGFHEKASSYVADMTDCHVLPRHVADLLVPLRQLITSLSIRDRMPQFELAVGQGITVLVLRILQAPSVQDETLIKAFADQHQIHFWVQPKGPETVVPYYPAQSDLHYTLPEFGIRMPFKPTDFTQVNHQINDVLVSRAIALLDVQPQHRVADLFCGLGNFTLPLATRAKSVLGVEGSTQLTERALANAKVNGVGAKTAFECANLFECTPDTLARWGQFDRMLIDPPREGAQAVAQSLAHASRHTPELAPPRIVYVSCNPSTLARDAAILHHEGEYTLESAGVVNMFPHTSHVESMAVFVRKN